MRVSTTSTPSATGSAPPDSPEPAPRATHGISSRAHSCTIAWTSSAVPGEQRARGRAPVLEQPVGLVCPQA